MNNEHVERERGRERREREREELSILHFVTEKTSKTFKESTQNLLNWKMRSR